MLAAILTHVPAATADDTRNQNLPSPRQQLDEAAGFKFRSANPGNPELHNPLRYDQRQRKSLRLPTDLRRLFTAAQPADDQTEQKKELDQKQDALFELKKQEAMLLEKLGNSHPKVIETQKKIELLSEFLSKSKKELSARQKEINADLEKIAKLKELHAHSKAISKRLEDTEDKDTRNRLQAELGELKEVLQRLTQNHREPEKVRHKNRSGEIHHEISVLEKKKIGIEQKLNRTDSEEEKEELKDILHAIHREQDELQHALHEREHGREHEHHDDEPRDQLERIRAMHEAAERLERAGVHDMAREIHRQAEELEREIHHHRRERHHHDDAVHELMENIHELREEVGEIHGKLDEILEFIEEVRDEEDEEDEGDDDETIDLSFKPKRVLPIWWKATDRMLSRERAKAKKESQKVYTFGGITLNR